MPVRKNERYRLATQLRKGMEVRMKDGSWVAIDEHMYITAPLKVVSVTLVGGARVPFAPRELVMSRIPEAPK